MDSKRFQMTFKVTQCHQKSSVVKVKGLKVKGESSISSALSPSPGPCFDFGPFCSNSEPISCIILSQCCSFYNTHHHNIIKISYYDAWFLDFNWFIFIYVLSINRFYFPCTRKVLRQIKCTEFIFGRSSARTLWGSSRPDPLVEWGRNTPSPLPVHTTPTASRSRRLSRLVLSFPCNA